MVTVKLWSFGKKKNSTKVPTTAGQAFTGEFKTGVSILSPVVKLSLTTHNAPIYNYAYIEAFRRYYFIREWSFDSGFWYASMTVDVLASFKTEIGNTTQFVTRAYSDYNPNIIDSLYPTTGDIWRISDSTTPAEFWGADPLNNTGTVVLGVVGKSASGVGAVTYYAMSMIVFRSFMSTFLSSINWAGIPTTEISEELQKALVNPTQYITYCRWFPINWAGFAQGVSTNTIHLGWWSFTLPSGGTARELSTIASAWVTRTSELSIPKHPQAIARNTYLQQSPYSSYTLTFLPFGVFDIDSTDLFEKDTLGINVDVNLMSGDAVLRLCSKTVDTSYDFVNNAFLVWEGQIGVSLPVGQVSLDIPNNNATVLASGALAAADVIGPKLLGGG